MDTQKFCLKWDGFQGSVISVFDSLRQDSELVDVTLCCEGQRVRAHRMMLSACSPYFRELFKDMSGQQLVIFLKDTSSADLTAIVEFMYKGCVNVTQKQLASFIKTAEMLQVQGLSGGEEKDQQPAPAPPPPAAPPRAWSRPPASPAGGARRAPDPVPPAEPRAKRRRAEPEPPPPPLPLPPVEQGVQEQPAQPEQFESPVKVEKFDVDLTLEDEEDPQSAGDGMGAADDGLDGGGDGLDAALDHVAQYEGYDPGSDQSLSADGQMFGAAGGDGTLPGNASDPGGPYTPGPSQRTGEEGGQDLAPYGCSICGKRYWHPSSLVSHEQLHKGHTQCPVCGRVASKVSNLRKHLTKVHKLTLAQIRTMVPTAREVLAEYRQMVRS